MKLRNFLSVLACAALGCSFASNAVATEVVANPRNDEQIDKESLKLMLIGKEKFWSSGSEVVIAILKSDPSVDDALSRYSGMTTNKFKNHWQRIAFSGRGKMPKMFSSMEDLVKFIETNEGAIGIVSSTNNVETLRRIELGLVGRSQFTVNLASL
ncbi:hypothetical protein [Pelagicoccus sp. SDUM812005]|uniref:hypothetical protein n=1 Tax=Pelagicoccus sp. SDUM812005 TaxID=3041257 RepID=UPI00280CC76B|nr:hypothetical protein [Pelagicoccus sp. SDUM812005]MDQ8182062.1 hypothetical protein [Pelagicoccus sp. SDUM812005]